jgi:hypothetical protein
MGGALMTPPLMYISGIPQFALEKSPTIDKESAGCELDTPKSRCRVEGRVRADAPKIVVAISDLGTHMQDGGGNLMCHHGCG